MFYYLVARRPDEEQTLFEMFKKIQIGTSNYNMLVHSKALESDAHK